MALDSSVIKAFDVSDKSPAALQSVQKRTNAEHLRRLRQPFVAAT